jgi:hypothetical protein
MILSKTGAADDKMAYLAIEMAHTLMDMPFEELTVLYKMTGGPPTKDKTIIYAAVYGFLATAAGPMAPEVIDMVREKEILFGMCKLEGVRDCDPGFLAEYYMKKSLMVREPMELKQEYETNEHMMSKVSGKAVGPAWENKYAREMPFKAMPPRRLSEERHLATIPEGLTAFCAGRRRRQLGEEQPEDRELTAATGGMPSAYGSLLTKSNEWVVTFMGVKPMTEPSMFMYTIMQSPVYAQWGTTTVVTTEGYALYLGQMIYCMSVLAAGKKEPYVTGHSLGGSAAALYASLGVNSDAFLVTFGSSPMFPKSSMTTNVSPLGSMWVNMYDLKTTKNTEGDTFKYPFGVYPKSVRFFHKFDPIPSDLLWGSAWVHAAEKAYLLSDTPGCKFSPSSASSAGYNYWAAMYMPTLSDIYTFVCSDYDVSQSSQLFGGKSGATYYSYFSFFNPFPCADVVISETYKILDASMEWYGPKPFVTFETMEECTTSFTGTLDAYFDTFIGLYMFDSRIIDLDTEADQLQAITYFGNFALGYVHSTYPFYVLGEEYGDAMKPSAALAEPEIPEFVTTKMKGKESAFMKEYGEYIPGGNKK